MYSSRGNSGYGQQSYAGQSAYGQQEPDLAELAGYRAHPSAATHYGGQYSSVYGAAALGGAQQAASMSSKAPGSSALEGRSGYASTAADSPKFASGDYVSSSSHGYGKKGDPLYPEKTSDYQSIDRRQYAERQSAYIGRDLPSEPTGRYTDYPHQLQPEIYDRIDQATLLRQEQLLKSQSQSLEANRASDYLAARGASIRHPAQDLMAYGGRLDADPRNLSLLSGPAPSILGAAPRRNVDDLAYSQSSSNPGYGVSLPPGRDYATGKGIHGTSFESDYHSSLLSRGGRIDDLKDDRVGYVRELEMREEERRREKLREREKDREREKERERERDRERQRERDRERDRERERERILERRERERSRERKREAEARRDRTPPRVSKDRLGSKDGRSLRRDSPRPESLHRRHSPIREKRREYVCKVNSSSLVELERNYVSLDKRYPRLYVAPEFTKLVVNWPRENLKLSIHTPVSFEHDFVEEEILAEQKDLSVPMAVEQVKQESETVVRNAKMVLMSGLSKNSLEELSYEKSVDDRIPHFCNILRFAILKKDRSFMAIGGPWDPIDGGDPSVDDSCLVQTVLRHAKDLTQLDLQNCKNWNPFIEIHYDRVGKDGLFSHKEVTVIFLPDLSECLPELDTWRDQWLAHKKAVAERERLQALKKEKAREAKEAAKDNGDKKTNDDKKGNDDKEVKGSAGKKKDVGDEKKVEKKDGGEKAEEAKQTENNEGKSTVAKIVKKKLVKKVVKSKASGKNGAKNAENKEKDKSDDKGSAEKKKATSGATAQAAETSADAAGVKNFTRKKVAKKVPAGKSAEEDDKVKTPDVKTEKEDKQETSAKTTVKKKVIKRVPKKKANGGEAKTETADKDETAVVAAAANDAENKATPKGKSKTGSSDKKEAKADKSDKKEEKGSSGKKDSATKGETTEADKQKVTEKDNKDKGEKSKEDTEKKDKSEKDASKTKASAEGKEKKKPEEPPRHPGLFLRTKWRKESKIRSLSLSLDSLLDYTDKDTEESTFELSLFAETMHEMLQYQMGCRLLTFLKKLRIKFVKKRNQRKRAREETSEKEKDKKSSSKRSKTDEVSRSKADVKTDEPTSVTKSAKSEKPEAGDHDDKETKEVKEEATTSDGPEKEKQEDEKENQEDEEDPEEDPEEDEEMQDADPQNDSSNENEEEKKKTEEKTEKEKAETEESAAKEEANEENSEAKAKSDSKETETEAETDKKEAEAAKEVPVDKELLQAFRFFDRNRVGYIRVEDMRLIIHTLGKFLSHRDVKELVQSALIETNPGRDDRILYNKLVRMPDL